MVGRKELGGGGRKSRLPELLLTLRKMEFDEEMLPYWLRIILATLDPAVHIGEISFKS